MTRPDISAVVSFIKRQMASPTARHWGQAKRVLRYLSGTMDFRITFSGSISPEILI